MGLGLKCLVGLGTHKMLSNELHKIVNKVVSEKSIVIRNAGIVAHGGQPVEVEFGREHGLQSVENEVAGLLEDLLSRVAGFVQKVLKLF